MMPIERHKSLSKREKFYLKLGNFLKIRLGTYSLSALAGITAGHYTQETERDITGYNTIKHEKVIKDYEQHKVEAKSLEEFKQERNKTMIGSIKGWFSDAVQKIKKNGIRPEEYIKDTEMYKDLLIKYYSTLKFIDDVAFLAPALLMFVMLGGYLTKKLTDVNGDVAEKEEHRRLVKKINQLVDVSNAMYYKIEKQGVESLSGEEILEIRNMLLESKEALPEEGL